MSTAQTLDGKYNVKTSDVEKLGGQWNDEIAAYVFPDRSMVRFSDLQNGALEQTRTGEPIFHVVALDGEYLTLDEYDEVNRYGL